MSRPITKGGQTAAEKSARREEVCDRILAALAKGPRTVAEIMAELKLKDSTACRYLNYLCEMGEVHRSEERGPHNCQIWVLGREGVSTVLRPAGSAFGGVKVVPARQVGMWRHWMDVAFFGPARAQS